MPALIEPAPGGVCRVCDQRMNPGSLACSHCGAVYGAANRCPNCRAVAGTEPATGLGRCRVCGALRFSLSDANVVRTGREAPLLRRADRARRSAVFRVALGAVAGGVAMFALSATLLAIGLLDPGSVVAALGFVFAAIALLGAASLAGKARRADRERVRAIEQARLLIAADVVGSRRSIEASELARELGVDTNTAELLLAEIQVNDFVHARVSEDGEIGAAPARPSPASEPELEEEEPVSAPAAAERNPAR